MQPPGWVIAAAEVFLLTSVSNLCSEWIWPAFISVPIKIEIITVVLQTKCSRVRETDIILHAFILISWVLLLILKKRIITVTSFSKIAWQIKLLKLNNVSSESLNFFWYHSESKRYHYSFRNSSFRRFFIWITLTIPQSSFGLTIQYPFYSKAKVLVRDATNPNQHISNRIVRRTLFEV